MTVGRLLLTGWELQPSVLGGLGLLLVAYLLWCREASRRQRLIFSGGALLLALALVSPLDLLADGYLFSAHMVQHMLLILGVAPLLLLGLPSVSVRRLLRWGPAARLERVLGWPPLAWGLATVVLWGWHLPVLYQAALRHELLHILQHLSLLLTATLFWWPVLAPQRAGEASLLAAWATALYLAAAMVSSSVLGIIFTLSSTVVYPVYQALPDDRGLWSLIRDQWQLAPLADQQLGGAVMWVLGGLPYLAGVAVILVRWFAEPEEVKGVG